MVSSSFMAHLQSKKEETDLAQTDTMSDGDNDLEEHFSEDSDQLDSDEELQRAFAKGEIKGTVREIVVDEKEVINDVKGIEAQLVNLRKNLPWLERLDLSVEPAVAIPGATEITEDDKVHNDFKRELHFYRLAQSAVLVGLPALHKLGLPTKRPEDYFAQMAKSDDHMKKIRQKLLSESIAKEQSERLKKLRELKKVGKKVQTEVLLARQKEKKEMMEAVKKYRKGQQDKLDFLDDGDSGKSGKKDKGTKKGAKSNDRGKTRSVQKRAWRNAKFGFGGQKKRSKQNTAESSADMSGYNRRLHGTTPNKNKLLKKKAKKTQRAGKSKRMKAKTGK